MGALASASAPILLNIVITWLQSYLATFIVLAENAAEAEPLVLERYKSYPDKFEYDKIYVYYIGFRSEKFLALLKGEVLELAQGRMEVFDELDAEIIG